MMSDMPAPEEVRDFLSAAWDGDIAALEAFNAKYPGRLEVTKGEPIGWNALMWAAGHGTSESICWLVGHGARIDAWDANGWTPLMIAAGRGHGAAVQALLDKGADLRAADKNGKCAIDLARASEKADTTALLEAAIGARELQQQAAAALQQHMRTVAKSGRFRVGGVQI